MSLQLTLARAEARVAEERWHDHFHLCPPCSRWVRRSPGERGCPAGQELRAHHREAQACAKEESRLERQPGPGQGALW